MKPDTLYDHAKAWQNSDPDPVTRAQIQQWIDEKNTKALETCFGTTLSFGTAGLRGKLGPGPAHMNRLMVSRVTAATCRYLDGVVPDAKNKGICVGYDGRHQSRAFAEDVMAIASALGFKINAFQQTVPTPLLAFSVLDQKAAAGVMITASHNPPEYNGYKLYWGNGAQIIPPHDQAIAKELDKITKEDFETLKADSTLNDVQLMLLEAISSNATWTQH